MKHITILVPEGQANLSSIVGAYKIFTRANAYWMEQGNKSRYTIELAGIAKDVNFHDGLFTVHPHKHISQINHTDLVIIPSLNHHYNTALKDNKLMMQWISERYKVGAEIASICTGAFMLAATGLLNGKTCSTHWAFAHQLREMFPAIKVQPDTLITDEGGIYTNGGAYSFLNLIVYLVEKYFDRTTAIFCSKVFQIEIDRQSQSTFIIFKGQKTHADDAIKQAQQYMEANFQERISIEALASQLAIGRRNFDRRFIKATGNTPMEYLQRLKIEAAKRAFETSRKNISEVMYEVGYADVKAFRELFRKITGLSPLEYRMKFNKELMN